MNNKNNDEKKIPKPKKISDKKVIEILREELKRKDETITRLRQENELLLKVSMKNAKKKMDEHH